MIAIIETGGKQYKVKAGDTLDIELTQVSKSKGVKLDKVLLLADGDKATVGQPFVKGAFVDAELVDEVKSAKTISFKYIRREKAATKIGHRQKYLRVKIKSVHAGA